MLWVINRQSLAKLTDSNSMNLAIVSLEAFESSVTDSVNIHIFNEKTVSTTS